MSIQRIEKKQLATMLDHTILKSELGSEALEASCEVARKYDVGCMCVKPCDVAAAVSLLKDTDVEVISVVGFPLGISKSNVKAFEAEQLIADGALGIDMVMNVSALKSANDKLVAEDIRAVVNVNPDIGVKVIIETCFLTDDEKIRASKIIVDAGAKYVKTSTGFGTGGATTEDIRLIRSVVGPEFGVKASAGIRTFETATAMIKAGASRLGVTATEAIMQGWEEKQGDY